MEFDFTHPPPPRNLQNTRRREQNPRLIGHDGIHQKPQNMFLPCLMLENGVPVDRFSMSLLLKASQKKRKLGTSILVLGTGGGDALALDVASGQLKWRISDCHPGGVNAVSSSAKASCIYSGGADGMVCEIDLHIGNLIRKFKASTKAVSCLSVSPGLSLEDLLLPLVSSNTF